MLVYGYKLEFYVRKVRKIRNLGNVKICESPFVMSRTDAQNGPYSIFNYRELYFAMLYIAKSKNKIGRKNTNSATRDSGKFRE